MLIDHHHLPRQITKQSDDRHATLDGRLNKDVKPEVRTPKDETDLRMGAIHINTMVALREELGELTAGRQTLHWQHFGPSLFTHGDADLMGVIDKMPNARKHIVIRVRPA